MLHLCRGPIFTPSELERIEEGAIRILEQVGVRVLHDGVRETTRRAGFAFRGDRALVERSRVRAFLDAERARNGNLSGPEEDRPPAGPLTLGVSQYSEYRHDVETDRIVPFTAETLIEATKIVDGLAEDGIRAGAPGTPMDVAPELQSVACYWTSLTYSRHGQHPLDPRSVAAHRYVMEMAACVGRPIKVLPVYVVSPLCLGGLTLDAVLAFRDRITTAWVVSMPSLGATAPIGVGDAYAVSTAEIVGSAIILKEITDLEIGWEVQMFPFDLRRTSIVFGSPENFLLQLATAEVNAFLHGTRWTPAAANIHTMAKVPGPQAAAEKASLMTTGALLGARHFVHAGTLSLDEVFSPEQLVIDCEIRDHVAHLVGGLDGDCDPDGCAADVAEGIERGFMGLDSTVAGYRSACWYPRLFERGLLGSWREAGSPDIRPAARERVRAALARHDFALPADVQREIDRIYARAKTELVR